MCSELCATPFSESASGVPTTPMPTDLITGLLPEQHWMVAAEKRVRSDCCPNRRISHGSQTRMRFYLYPHKRMTASEQTYSENFELCLWRGILFLCVFFFFKITRSKSSRHHHAGANCGLRFFFLLAMTCSELTRFAVPCQPRIVRCHFTLRCCTQRLEFQQTGPVV